MWKKYFWVFFISMVPLIEIRGSIPYAYYVDGINFPLACVIAVIANMIPVPIIFFFARKVLEWGKDKKIIGKFFTFCLEKGHKGGAKLEEKAGKGLYWALFLFVGIPLPGTGAWTGTLAASILDMDFKKSIIAVLWKIRHMMNGVSVFAKNLPDTASRTALYVNSEPGPVR